jgi:hypothetical protein
LKRELGCLLTWDDIDLKYDNCNYPKAQADECKYCQELNITTRPCGAGLVTPSKNSLHVSMLINKSAFAKKVSISAKQKQSNASTQCAMLSRKVKGR